MRHPKIINFRTSSDVAEAVTIAAQATGVSVSEFLRQAVEDRLAKVPPATVPTKGVVDPFSLLARAARGNLDAQRELARIGVQMACSGRHDVTGCFLEAMVFARLAAAQGEMADQGLVISIAMLMGEILGEQTCESETAEAIARLAIADEAGSEEAGEALRQLIAGASPGLTALVQEYLARIRGQVARETV